MLVITSLTLTVAAVGAVYLINSRTRYYYYAAIYTVAGKDGINVNNSTLKIEGPWPQIEVEDFLRQKLNAEKVVILFYKKTNKKSYKK